MVEWVLEHSLIPFFSLRKVWCWSTATPACHGHQQWSLATWCHVMASPLMLPFHWSNQLGPPHPQTLASWNNWGATKLRWWMDPNTKERRENVNGGLRTKEFENLEVIPRTEWKYFIEKNIWGFHNVASVFEGDPVIQNNQTRWFKNVRLI